MIILPQKILRTIITVDAITNNTIYIVYQSLNGNYNLIFSHYGKAGARKDDFMTEIRNINRTIRAVRSKFPYCTVSVCGDFNVRSTSPRYRTLTEEMSKSDLVPAFNEIFFTWFPQKLQALTKKPTKIDYIFTTEDILEISEIMEILKTTQKTYKS